MAAGTHQSENNPRDWQTKQSCVRGDKRDGAAVLNWMGVCGVDAGEVEGGVDDWLLVGAIAKRCIGVKGMHRYFGLPTDDIGDKNLH